MIRKSLIYAICLATIYLVLAPALWSKRKPLLQSLRQENLVRIQNVIYQPRLAENLILGSSLANMMDTDILGTNFQMLAIAGQSSVTGLQLLKRTDKLPKRIIIETHFLHRTWQSDLTDSLDRPVISQLRKYVPGFREQFRPATILARKVSRLLKPI